jgi:hypothetical protein
LNAFLTHLSLAAPLFVLVLAGYLIARSGRFPAAMAEALNRFVFTLALPALLFRMMAGLSSLPPVDTRLLAAFFGLLLAVPASRTHAGDRAPARAPTRLLLNALRSIPELVWAALLLELSTT